MIDNIEDRIMEDAIAHLRALASGKITPMDVTEGVCYELKQLYGGEIAAFLTGPTSYWPEYSGDPLFPVPGPGRSCPKAAFLKHTNHWGIHPYGQARRRLCAYLADLHNGDL